MVHLLSVLTGSSLLPQQPIANMFLKRLNLFLLATCLVSIMPIAIRGLSIEEFLTLTLPQKEKLDEFAERVKPWITQPYMLRELYLIRWLREVYFDVDEAEKLFRSNLKWREENDIDHILEGDYSELDNFFTTEVYGCDKEGRPILSILVRDWDLRAIMLKFGVERLVKYADKIVEEACDMQRRMEDEGQNVTQFSVIADIDGFNLVQHACPNCVAFILRLISRLQYNYPGYVHKLVGVNTPQIAMPFWEIAKRVVMRSLLEAVEIHGFNKRVWERSLQKWIDPSQLSTHFGGLRKKGIDIQEYRLSGETLNCNTLKWKEIDDYNFGNYFDTDNE